MTFKANQEESEVKSKKMSDKLYKGFVDLIQFEIDKLTFISSAKFYFYTNGLMQYKKFFAELYKSCEEIKCCLINQLRKCDRNIPELIIRTEEPFNDSKKPFEVLAKMEDTFERVLNDLINIAFEDKDWNNFYYLLKKLDKIDHICCRALAAIENGADISMLCEQRISEKQ